MQPLKDKVAVVTGASRSAGRGIAQGLGKAGATVYVTGRSVSGSQTRSDLPHTTIDETARLVTEAGGRGIPVRCDHSNDRDIQALFEQVEQEVGQLDILVNNAWAGYQDYDDTFDAPFWQQPIARFDNMFTVGVRSHMVTSYYALPLLMKQKGKGALIINTTLEMDYDFYDAALFYRTAKIAKNYLTFGMAHDLRERGGYDIAVIGVAPGWMRTEEFQQKLDEGIFSRGDLEQTESVEAVGKAVVALATDPNVLEKTGQTLRTRDLAVEYGFIAEAPR